MNHQADIALLEQILQDSTEQEQELNAKLEAAHPWLSAKELEIKSQCWKMLVRGGMLRKTADQEAEDLAQKVVEIFLHELVLELWGADLKKIGSPEHYRFRKPDHWLRRVATNVCKQRLREWRRSRSHIQFRSEGDRTDNGREHIPSPFGQIASSSKNVESRLIDESAQRMLRDSQLRERYVRELSKLPKNLVRAWVMAHASTLTPDEKRRLIGTRLLRKLGEQKSPVSQKAIANLLNVAESTVSSNVSRARKRLRAAFADIDPLRASRHLPRPYAREFLVGRGSHSGSNPKWVSMVRARDLPAARRNSYQPRTLVPGWLCTPELEDEADVRLRDKIGGLRKAKKRYSTIAKILNEDGDRSRFGGRWHATGVEKFFTGRIEPKKSRLRILGTEYADDDLAEENHLARQWLPESADFTERLRVMQVKSPGAFQTWLRGLPAAAQRTVTRRLANPITVQGNHIHYCRLTSGNPRVLEQAGMSAWTGSEDRRRFPIRKHFR